MSNIVSNPTDTASDGQETISLVARYRASEAAADKRYEEASRPIEVGSPRYDALLASTTRENARATMAGMSAEKRGWFAATFAGISFAPTWPGAAPAWATNVDARVEAVANGSLNPMVTWDGPEHKAGAASSANVTRDDQLQLDADTIEAGQPTVCVWIEGNCAEEGIRTPEDARALAYALLSAADDLERISAGDPLFDFEVEPLIDVDGSAYGVMQAEIPSTVESTSLVLADEDGDWGLTLSITPSGYLHEEETRQLIEDLQRALRAMVLLNAEPESMNL